jgi:diguanylate cyclase (GGDEF)-like protein
MDTIKQAIRWADTLHDEQRAALAAHDKGHETLARAILFGAEYERELDRVRNLVDRFEYQLEQRTGVQIAKAEETARLWKGVSEIALAVTGLLFLCVLYFVFRQRVLKPVVRLSDVVNRLAAQDYAAEPPNISQIDEIGDMAQAIRVFRENGLERQRLQEERESDRALRDLLSRMTQRMQGSDSLEDLKEVVRCFVPEIAPELAGRFYVMDPARDVAVEACQWGTPGQSQPEFSPTSCWAIRRGLPHRSAGAAIDVPCGHLGSAEDVMRDTLCLPLNAHGEIFGLLYFERRPESARAIPTAQGYLNMLAENVGLAVANLRLRDQLRAMAMCDALTGLANRRQLSLSFKQLLARADQTKQPITCLMIDVDHFKQFNDDFGHNAGDLVLREVGAVLRGVVREKELAFRYGGEEFLLLLPGLDTELATARAEQIRDRIAGLSLSHEGVALGPVHASVGLATSPTHCSAERLVQAADAALLRAKAEGRDRVTVAAVRSHKSAA